MPTQSEFHWLSPLGISVILFLLHGIFYILIGMLAPVFMDRSPVKPEFIIMSYRTDKALLGDEPETINKENKPLHDVMHVMLPMLAGMLVAAGLCIVSIAWFGIRTGQMWALITMAIVGAVILPFWWLAFKPYFDAGIKITLSDAPPFIWVPAVLYLPAVILGWIGLR